ncbi:MAG: hypothetical protein IJT12_03815 [Paludibacteraceae bacterium]|nr:hypothetical protein [Paludibacteraceae bacterium]
MGSLAERVTLSPCDPLPNTMAKITLHGMFARVKGKFNRSETLYFKGCPCKREQLGVDLLNPSKAKAAKNVQCQDALKTAAQAAKTALADAEQRAALEEAFKAQSKYTSLFAYTVAQKYVKPTFA